MIFLENLQTKTPGNSRKHWRSEGAEARLQRLTTFWSVKARMKDLPAFPVRVVLTRVSPRSMDRHNLPGAMKHIVDGVADAYGVDDGDDRWQFEFRQEKDKTFGVKIEIFPATAPVEQGLLFK